MDKNKLLFIPLFSFELPHLKKKIGFLLFRLFSIVSESPFVDGFWIFFLFISSVSILLFSMNSKNKLFPFTIFFFLALCVKANTKMVGRDRDDETSTGCVAVLNETESFVG